jgi:hypothetical protein
MYINIISGQPSDFFPDEEKRMFSRTLDVYPHPTWLVCPKKFIKLNCDCEKFESLTLEEKNCFP